jgi:hypothetical protein
MYNRKFHFHCKVCNKVLKSQTEEIDGICTICKREFESLDGGGSKELIVKPE